MFTYVYLDMNVRTYVYKYLVRIDSHSLSLTVQIIQE